MKKVLITILVILLLGNLLGMSGIIAGDLVTNSNRTLAQQSPYIVKTIPYDGTINVGLNEDIIIGFSEPMNTATITYSCSPLPSGGFSASWGSDIINVTFSHLSAFEKYTIYVFEVTSGQDLDGNPLIADVIPNPFNFKTVGDDPLIIETIPAHDATGVALDSDIVVKFNNPMNTSTITYQCTPSVAGGFTAQWNVDNNAVTFSQASGFVKNTQYTFAITAGKDEKGMDLIPSPIPNPWNFTTYSKGPSINHTTPGQNTTHVALNADIIVKFSEPMNTSTVLFAISPDPGGWSASWNALNDEVTFTHSNPFVKNTYHTFQITAGKDLHGLELEPSDLNPWSFTTVGGGYDDPFIIETTPVNGAVNVSLAAEIVIEFSSPMNSTTVQYSITPTVGGFTANWNLDNTEVTYQHTINFVKKTLHTFTITAAKDEEGFDLNDGWVPNPFAFTTIGDNPIIEGTTPADGTTGVALNADIIVEFSKPMNTGTVVFTSDPVPAAGFTASWNTDGDIVTFLHDADFIEDYVYTVRVASGKDLDGYDLVAGVIPNPFVFRTIGDSVK